MFCAQTGFKFPDDQQTNFGPYAYVLSSRPQFLIIYTYLCIYIFCLTNYYAKPPKSGAKKGCEFSKETRRSRNSSGGGERTILQKTEDTSLRLMEVIHFRTNCFSSGVKSKSKFRLTAMFIYIILLRCQNIHRLIYPLTFDFRCSLVCFLFPFFCFFLL